MKVKIAGYGWVGKAMHQLFPEAIIVDPEQGFTSKETASVLMVCVPTPNLQTGELDTSIVEEVVKGAKEDLIVIRSTVMPGTCDDLAAKYEKRIVFQPEYLGETTAHPLLDQGSRPFIIVGGEQKDCREVIELYQGVYNANINIRQLTRLEAEVVKLSENRAIMFKVAQCQELYDACEAAGVDYYNIRQAVYGDDPRFDLWFSFVYPEARGANSKCIPKDVYGWNAWAESVGSNADLTHAMLVYNQRLLDEKNS